MAVQTSIQQRSAQPAIQNDLSSSNTMTPAAVLPREGADRPESMQAATGERAVAGPSRPAEKDATTVTVAVAVLAVAALVGAGLMRSRIEPALRRLITSAENIRVPLVLPVILVDAAREILADRRAVESAMPDRHRAS